MPRTARAKEKETAIEAAQTVAATTKTAANAVEPPTPPEAGVPGSGAARESADKNPGRIRRASAVGRTGRLVYESY